MSFISFLILDGIGSEQLRFGAALQTHWLQILRVGNLTHENFRWHRYSPLFQIARRSLILLQCAEPTHDLSITPRPRAILNSLEKKLTQ
jgi:hypothetical protein